MLTLRSAQEYIDIQAPYFNPSDWFLDELLQAAGRGIRIRILTNSDVSVDVI
ncbi:MAG: phospholipase D family protein [Planctomycetota bacterium]|nr:MAG: phospholipase D family protein [Planctomycetota bacterium]